MMNKWFAGLMVCGLACGLAACSDDDDNKKGGNCLNEEPALVTEAAKLETAVKADGVTFTKEADPDDPATMLDVASDCEKFAVNMSNYLNDNEGQNSISLFEAIKDYPKFSGSFLGVLCGLIDTNKTIQAAAKVKNVYDVGTNCVRVHKNDMDAEAKGKLDTSLAVFSNADNAEAWNNVLQAAASEAAKQGSNQ